MLLRCDASITRAVEFSKATRNCKFRLLGERETRWDERRFLSDSGRTSVTDLIFAIGL